MKKLNNILVPTDYSNNAQAAFNYALSIAEEWNAEVKVIHIYSDYMPVAPLSDPLIIPSGESEEEIEQRLKDFVDEMIENIGGDVKTKVHITTEIAEGTPIEVLVEKSKDGEADLIVMGTTGEKSVGEIFFGSVATGVSQKAYCPVMLIPGGYNFKPIKNMVYACNIQEENMIETALVAEFARMFGSDVHLLYVGDDDRNHEKYEEDLANLKNAFKNVAPEIEVVTSVVEEETVVDGVNHYGKANNADLIAVVTKHRSFWDRMLHVSISKQLAMYAELPVLIIHKD